LGFHGNNWNEGDLSVHIAVEYSDQGALAEYDVFSLQKGVETDRFFEGL
jgi:hypothetical protein